MDSQRDRIREQASEWVIETHDPQFAEDEDAQAKLVNWLARSDAHGAAYQHAKATFERLTGPTLQAFDVGFALQSERSPRSRVGPSIAWGRWVAFLTAFVIGVSVPWMPQIAGAAPRLYTTGIGEQRTVILDDGSELRLNSDSRVVVQSRGRYQEVDVLWGEAYFNLTPQARRPIRVFTSVGMVSGRPHQFAVSQADGAAHVVAVDGELSLVMFNPADGVLTHALLEAREADPARHVALRSGDLAVLQTGRQGVNILVAERTRTELDQLLAWREGLLAFNNESAQTVIESFNRYSRQKMVIEDAEIAGLRLSGTFRFNDPHSFILALKRVYPQCRIVADTDADRGVVHIRRSAPSEI
jgi:transmembrane sensor